MSTRRYKRYQQNLLENPEVQTAPSTTLQGEILGLLGYEGKDAGSEFAYDTITPTAEVRSADRAWDAYGRTGQSFRGGDFFSGFGHLGTALTDTLGAVPLVGLGVKGVRSLTEPIADAVVKEAPVFYSKLTNFFKDAPQNKAQGRQWQGMLDPQKSGVKTEEVEYTGIKSLLDENPNKVFSKEELQDVAESNAIQVEEKVYGETTRSKEDIKRLTEIEQQLDDIDFRYDNLLQTAQSRGVPTLPGQPIPNKHSRTKAHIDFDEERLKLADAKRKLEQERHGLTKYDPESEVKHSGWQLGGGENYKELVLRLPNRQKVYRIEDKRTGELSPHEFATAREAEREIAGQVGDRGMMSLDAQNYGVKEVDAVEGQTIFQHPHFPDKNPLLHVRFNDRIDADGGRQLFIEELQSDWAQAGRDKGFRDVEKHQTEMDTLLKRKAETLEEYQTIAQKVFPDLDKTTAGYHLGRHTKPRIDNPTNNLHLDRFGDSTWNETNPITKEEFERAVQLQAEYTDLYQAQDNLISDSRRNPPPVPFVTKTDRWTDLGLRRMLRWAVDNGYDSVGWTTGLQQVNRYETAFRQQVKSLKFDDLSLEPQLYKNPETGEVDYRDGWDYEDSEGFTQNAVDDGDVVPVTRHGGNKIDSGEDWEDTTELLLEVGLPNGGQTHITFEKRDSKWVTSNEYEGDIQPLEKVVGKDVAKRFYEGETFFEGDDLTIGGEGMKESYDRIIPKRMKEIARKMGEKNVKIEKANVRTGEKVKASRLRYEVHDESGSIDAFETREEAEGRLEDLAQGYGGNTFVVDSYVEDVMKSNSLKEPAWSMKITDKMRDAIKKGLPLMVGAGVTAGLLKEQEKQKGTGLLK